MSDSVELAERPRHAESWREMIERQQKEGGAKEGFSRELLRSLPDEQRQENGPRGRGEIVLDHPLVAEDRPISYHDMLESYARPPEAEPPAMER